MSVKIFRMPQSLGHGLRLFIENELYEDSFKDVAEMRMWFIQRPKHLKGNGLPHEPMISETVIVETYGKDGEHHVLSHSNGGGPYLVVGPSAKLRGRLFAERPDAADYAISEAMEYDSL